MNLQKDIIYRVEKSDKLGPYNGLRGEEKLREMYDYHNSLEFPSIHEDFNLETLEKFAEHIRPIVIGVQKYPFKTGFESQTKLKSWFNGYMQTLHELGYKCTVYFAEYIESNSKKQIIFNYQDAKEIEKITLLKIS